MRSSRSTLCAYKSKRKCISPSTSPLKLQKRKKERKKRVMSGEETKREEEIEDTVKESGEKLKERKVSWAKLRRVDSLNLEAGRVSTVAGHHSKVYIFLYPTFNTTFTRLLLVIFTLRYDFRIYVFFLPIVFMLLDIYFPQRSFLMY